jgi:HK97 gp10 family phage protein
MKIRFTPNRQDQEKLKDAPRRIEKGVESGIKSGMQAILARAKRFDGSNQLKIKTGSLRASISVSTKKQGDNWIGYIGSDEIYAKIHEYGGTIQPRFGAWLHFRTESGWKKVKKVTIPPRPFLRPAAENSKDEVADILNKNIISAWKGRILGIL